MAAVTHTLATPAVDLVYDVITPEPGVAVKPPRPTLLMAGHPMEASGFASLASYFGDRIVVTYDPRGLGRSVRRDGRGDRGPELHVADLHALITELGAPVDVFASSGGAVNLLALVAAHPDDVHTLVAHEPPLLTLLPDAATAVAAERGVQQTYRDSGWGAGMAAFMGLTSWQGEFNDAYFAQPVPDPAAFGMPSEDDGSRDDPLLSGTANEITSYRPSAEAINAAPTRVVLGLGVETGDTLTGRTTPATAQLLGIPVTPFPSHHGGFLGGEGGYVGQPEAFAARLREVLDENS